MVIRIDSSPRTQPLGRGADGEIVDDVDDLQQHKVGTCIKPQAVYRFVQALVHFFYALFFCTPSFRSVTRCCFAGPNQPLKYHTEYAGKMK